MAGKAKLATEMNEAVGDYVNYRSRDGSGLNYVSLDKDGDDYEGYEEEEEEEEEEDDASIQLGFVEKSRNNLFNEGDWRNWDGGKVGGTPVSWFSLKTAISLKL